MKTKLKINCGLMQVPIGREKNFEGMIDVIEMKALYFKGSDGEQIIEQNIPPHLINISEQYRAILIEAVANVILSIKTIKND